MVWQQGEADARDIAGMEPVSYTHLDVYKRQSLDVLTMIILINILLPATCDMTVLLASFEKIVWDFSVLFL